MERLDLGPSMACVNLARYTQLSPTKDQRAINLKSRMPTLLGPSFYYKFVIGVGEFFVTF